MFNVNLIKIGSDSININNLEKIISDAKKWELETKEKFIFISSGAVKLGKDRVVEAGENFNSFTRSSLASIGQNSLMKLFDEISGKEKLVGQILLDDYVNREYIEKIGIENNIIIADIKWSILKILNFKKDRKLIQTLIDNLNNNVWSIINHNDALSDDELNNLSNKTDNDKNTIHISELLQKVSINIKRVIYLTNTNGLLHENKNTVLGGYINSEKDENYYRRFVEISKSNSGTGGMQSKLDCGFKVLDYGVNMSIISNSKNGLECLQNSRNSTIFEKNIN